MRVLVTGTSGFIGHALCARPLTDGHGGGRWYVATARSRRGRDRYTHGGRRAKALQARGAAGAAGAARVA